MPPDPATHQPRIPELPGIDRFEGIAWHSAEWNHDFDLRGKSAISDFMVVSSGRSNRHVGAVADRVLEDLHKAGNRSVRVEGMPLCDWVLIDAGDVIVHLFRPEIRTYYNLEKMWGVALSDVEAARQ